MRVINLHKAFKEEIDSCIYVGRNAQYHKKRYGFNKALVALANPYEVGVHGARGECVELYRKWLWRKIRQKDIQIINSIMSLKEDDVLGCWCVPNNECHANIIIKAWVYLREVSDK